ncbi:hypothetical protein ACG33_12960 [Steroidobacter denitrificans]|uniref:Luciferase-like domain-containing protein n=1 Tax=Steroidobacter denitrificans TaxID=465721 RepID=A0A127FE13_STEDE|nr:LLM class F420-dependent oxidoreductase [Steroidobacter denitrificans]AMN47991.1 hypothetical protein ACG33_12960 [Steroidobacter denitrificans]
MHIGVVFPQCEIGSDTAAIRAYVETAEALGFHHVIAIDHVVGANPASRPGWNGPYDIDTQFREPMVLLSFIAGMTRHLELVTGVMVLPQRQTVLVAKQAAELDMLSEQRFRLGVGTGWNEVEYEALGADFKSRGAVLDEQIELLRLIWTQRAVTYQTQHHCITDAGIAPHPARSVPIWLGGGGAGAPDGVLRRIARTADGWLPPFLPDAAGAERVQKMRTYCAEQGRDPTSLGIEGYVVAARSDTQWPGYVEAWRRLGATHAVLNMMDDGLSGLQAHCRRLEECAAVCGLTPR